MTLSNRNRALIWAVSGLVLTGLAYQFVDRAWSTYAHDTLHKPEWAVLLTKLGAVPFPLALLGLLAVAAVNWSGAKLTPVWRTILAASLAAILATFAVIVLKQLCGRPWPETWTHDNPSWIKDHVFGFLPLHGGAGYGSFPSGHTGRIAAPMTVAWNHIPRWRAAWITPLVLVIIGLLASDFHFASDCIGGIYLGVACGWLMLRLLPRRG